MNIDVYQLIELTKLKTEVENEKAKILIHRLRLLSKTFEKSEKSEKYEKMRKKLYKMVFEFETNYDCDDVTPQQNNKSDYIKQILEKEREFLNSRTRLLQAFMDRNWLSQKDLGNLLDYNQTIMFELMANIRCFNLNDLFILHELFKIDLKDLIFPFISFEDYVKYSTVLMTLD
jgi:hypothetical protein